MASIEELNIALAKICDEMAESTKLIADAPLEPVRENIHKIGTAIYELSEMREQIYEIRPDLKPAEWDEPPSEEAYGEMYEKALDMVKECLEKKSPQKAIEVLESFLFINPHETFEKKARDKIEDLKEIHGL